MYTPDITTYSNIIDDFNGNSKRIKKKIIKIIEIEEDDIPITISKVVPIFKGTNTKYHNEVRTFYPYEFESDDFYC